MNKNIKAILCILSPKLTTKLMFRYNFHQKLNLKNPQNINEKLQWLKLNTYYNNTLITKCVDKYEVRGYLCEKGFEKLLPSMLGGPFEEAAQVRDHWKEFPNRFVIKCNHGCGYNILVRDKEKYNIDEVIKKLDEWMKEDYWKQYCETQYRFVPKRIIVEEYLADNIQTYKFYCFNGKPEVVYVSSNGDNGEKDLYLDYFDLEWNWLPITLATHLHRKPYLEKPKNFEEMVELSKSLSKEFPFVRVDLYNVDGNIYFSELTFIPTGGNMKLKPEHLINEWGDKLNL